MNEHKQLIVKLIKSLFGVLALYWVIILFLFGPSASPDKYQRNLNVFVASFDDGFLGNSLTTFFAGINDDKTLPIPKFVILEDQGLTPELLTEKVNKGDAWAAAYMAPGATAQLREALNTYNTAYDPRNAITLVYDEGRSFSAVRPRAVLPTEQLLNRFCAGIASGALTQEVNQNISIVEEVATRAPNLLTQPVALHHVNLHPVTAAVTITALSLGQVFLVVFSLVTSLVVFQMAKHAAGTTGIAPISLVGALLIGLLLFTGALTLSLTGILAIFKTKFSDGKFVYFWFLQWGTMMIFSLLLIAIGLFQGLVAMPILFLFILVLNVPIAVNTLELASPFFKYGLAMPLYHTSMLSKTILYGSYNRLGLNLPVLAGWLVFALALFLLGCYKGKLRERSSTAVGSTATSDCYNEKAAS